MTAQELAKKRQVARRQQLSTLLGDAKEDPVETKPVETKPVETKPVETKPVETKPVETKPLPVTTLTGIGTDLFNSTGVSDDMADYAQRSQISNYFSTMSEIARENRAEARYWNRKGNRGPVYASFNPGTNSLSASKSSGEGNPLYFGNNAMFNPFSDSAGGSSGRSPVSAIAEAVRRGTYGGYQGAYMNVGYTDAKGRDTSEIVQIGKYLGNSKTTINEVYKNAQADLTARESAAPGNTAISVGGSVESAVDGLQDQRNQSALNAAGSEMKPLSDRRKEEEEGI